MLRYVLTAGLLAALTAPAVSDWPRWLGPEITGRANEQIADNWPEAGPAVLWTARVGRGFASPVVADRTVYLFSATDDDVLLEAFDVESGDKRWSASYTRRYRGDYPGARATPTVEAGKIYTYGAGGDLVCWSTADGEILWRANVLGSAENLTWGCASSPLIVGEAVIVQGGKDAPIAKAYHKNTGELLWQAQARGTGGYAAVVAAEVDGRVQAIVFAASGVFGLDPGDGSVLWRVEHDTRYDVNAATPIVRDGEVFVTSNYGSGGQLIRFDNRQGRRVWAARSLDSRFQPPIYDDGVVYINCEGTLRCFRWEDGEVLWSASDGRLNLGSGGSFVRAGDKLIALSDRGMLSMIEATPEGARLIRQVELVNQQNVWSMPVVCDGRLFVKTNNTLHCLDVSAD